MKGVGFILLDNHKQITKWYKLTINSEGKVSNKSFNHFEDGWTLAEYPKPFHESFTNQIGWQKELWVKEFTYLSDEQVII